MMTGRVALLLAVLVLTGMTVRIPVAQAEEGNEAALKRQLEAVQQQLHELEAQGAAHGDGAQRSAGAVSGGGSGAHRGPNGRQPAAPRAGDAGWDRSGAHAVIDGSPGHRRPIDRQPAVPGTGAGGSRDIAVAGRRS